MNLPTYQFTHSIERHFALKFLLFTPKFYDPKASHSWPLVIQLHGAGERGDDPQQLMAHSLPALLEHQDRHSFLLLAPQCPMHSWWIEQMPGLQQLLRDVLEAHAVDPQRIYLTGNSMGGTATWHWAALEPQRFAALLPICGGRTYWFGFPERAATLSHMPIRMFHGQNDSLVPLRYSQAYYDVLQRSGSKAEFEIYPDCDHDSWNRTYKRQDVIDWLLAQRRP